MPPAAWLSLLIDHEATFRDKRRLSCRPPLSCVKTATVENVDYGTARGLDRPLFQALATGQWVRNTTIWQFKSWLACALGNKACRDGFTSAHRVCLPTLPRPAAKDGWPA